nr:hypothetical protein L204_02480 [Cryptococcus depauperatus CBS 7855]
MSNSNASDGTKAFGSSLDEPNGHFGAVYGEKRPVLEMSSSEFVSAKEVATATNRVSAVASSQPTPSGTGVVEASKKLWDSWSTGERAGFIIGILAGIGVFAGLILWIYKCCKGRRTTQEKAGV